MIAHIARSVDDYNYAGGVLVVREKGRVVGWGERFSLLLRWLYVREKLGK
jgi:hypothetical protein